MTDDMKQFPPVEQLEQAVFFKGTQRGKEIIKNHLYDLDDTAFDLPLDVMDFSPYPYVSRLVSELKTPLEVEEVADGKEDSKMDGNFYLALSSFPWRDASPFNQTLLEKSISLRSFILWFQSLPSYDGMAFRAMTCHVQKLPVNSLVYFGHATFVTQRNLALDDLKKRSRFPTTEQRVLFIISRASGKKVQRGKEVVKEVVEEVVFPYSFLQIKKKAVCDHGLYCVIELEEVPTCVYCGKHDPSGDYIDST